MFVHLFDESDEFDSKRESIYTKILRKEYFDYITITGKIYNK